VKAPTIVAAGVLNVGERRLVRCAVAADWVFGVVGSNDVRLKKLDPVKTAFVGLVIPGVELENVGPVMRPFTVLAADTQTAMTGFHALGFLKSLFF